MAHRGRGGILKEASARQWHLSLEERNSSQASLKKHWTYYNGSLFLSQDSASSNVRGSGSGLKEKTMAFVWSGNTASPSNAPCAGKLEQGGGLEWIACKWDFQFITIVCWRFLMCLCIQSKNIFQGCFPFTVGQSICDTDLCRPSGSTASQKHGRVTLLGYKAAEENKCLFVQKK